MRACETTCESLACKEGLDEHSPSSSCGALILGRPPRPPLALLREGSAFLLDTPPSVLDPSVLDPSVLDTSPSSPSPNHLLGSIPGVGSSEKMVTRSASCCTAGSIAPFGNRSKPSGMIS